MPCDVYIMATEQKHHAGGAIDLFGNTNIGLNISVMSVFGSHLTLNISAISVFGAQHFRDINVRGSIAISL